jgi:hypothetical protein
MFCADVGGNIVIGHSGAAPGVPNGRSDGCGHQVGIGERVAAGQNGEAFRNRLARTPVTADPKSLARLTEGFGRDF